MISVDSMVKYTNRTHIKSSGARQRHRYHFSNRNRGADTMTDHTPTQPKTKEIPLTQGKFAIVDAADHEWLSQWKWRANKNGRTWYALRVGPRVNGKQAAILMHVVILGAKGVDHINGDGLDNRRSNLRLATNQQNQFNMRAQTGCASAFKGVCRDTKRKKWKAYITFHGKKTHLGYFHDELKAATAYDAKARELFGEYARLNFPEVPREG